ncbi:hypothetical protein MMYC01_210627 [Madurella mycetomatis]|uniref:Uncharacterized protein n=1 Tax=Madurella mycetomatis TaxID=100816 RepID=A0A175VPH7_9PEZI|nr:hypothetical protein MMYC01_210627 [Madurella mycetomatis]
MPGRKRKSAPAVEEAPSIPDAPASRRRSLRVSSSGQKSKYFEAESDSDSVGNGRTPVKPRGRGRPSKKAKVEEPEPDEDDYEDEMQESDKGVAESEEEFDEDTPPKVTYIPLPKMRDTGGIDYAEDRLHKNTLAFLKDLKANNKRSWLKAHDAEYRRALKDWESYVTTLADKIISADPTIPELPFKDVNFRIYRDIRFSNDPTPYKPHFAAAFSRTGRKGPYACYYVHLEPGGDNFVGGGLWHPDGGALAKLRASIDERPQRWRRVLCEPNFRDTFLAGRDSKAAAAPATKAAKKGKKKTAGGGGEAAGEHTDEEAVLKAFAEANKEGALKTRPKGFVAEHRDLELLKLRNFTVGKRVDDGVFTALEGGQEEVMGIVRALVGFITHLNRIVMPDPGDDSDSDEE